MLLSEEEHFRQKIHQAKVCLTCSEMSKKASMAGINEESGNSRSGWEGNVSQIILDFAGLVREVSFYLWRKGSQWKNLSRAVDQV